MCFRMLWCPRRLSKVDNHTATYKGIAFNKRGGGATRKIDDPEAMAKGYWKPTTAVTSTRLNAGACTRTCSLEFIYRTSIAVE